MTGHLLRAERRAVKRTMFGQLITFYRRTKAPVLLVIGGLLIIILYLLAGVEA